MDAVFADHLKHEAGVDIIDEIGIVSKMGTAKIDSLHLHKPYGSVNYDDARERSVSQRFSAVGLVFFSWVNSFLIAFRGLRFGNERKHFFASSYLIHSALNAQLAKKKRASASTLILSSC